MKLVMEGVVTIVQESRFQLSDDSGVSHLFLLSPHASLETDQLAPLQQQRTRVRVHYQPAKNLIGNVTSAIEVV